MTDIPSVWRLIDASLLRLVYVFIHQFQGVLTPFYSSFHSTTRLEPRGMRPRILWPVWSEQQVRLGQWPALIYAVILSSKIKRLSWSFFSFHFDPDQRSLQFWNYDGDSSKNDVHLHNACLSGAAKLAQRERGEKKLRSARWESSGGFCPFFLFFFYTILTSTERGAP